MTRIINMENAWDKFPCDVCGKTDVGHEMEEAFVPAWAWIGRPAGYDDPETDHSGFELNCLVDHGVGLGHGILCRACYHALYGSQGPQCYPFERRAGSGKKDAGERNMNLTTKECAECGLQFLCGYGSSQETCEECLSALSAAGEQDSTEAGRHGVEI